MDTERRIQVQPRDRRAVFCRVNGDASDGGRSSRPAIPLTRPSGPHALQRPASPATIPRSSPDADEPITNSSTLSRARPRISPAKPLAPRSITAEGKCCSLRNSARASSRKSPYSPVCANRSESDQTKNGEARTVPLPAVLVDILSHWNGKPGGFLMIRTFTPSGRARVLPWIGVRGKAKEQIGFHLVHVFWADCS